MLDLDLVRRGLAFSVVGEVLYAGTGAEGVDEGILVYVNLALSPADQEDLHEYRWPRATIPHEPTVDRFLDEAQFMLYRQLGHESGKAVAGV